MKKITVVVSLVALTFGLFSIAAAQNQNRSYHYDSIDYAIEVQADSTFTVQERQVYEFVGEYHQGQRFIPLNKIDAITDIKVIDAETGEPLEYSSKSLDKLEPSSWGKYTHYRKNSSIYIDWYYDLADTSHTWIIEYKVWGGISFYNDHDEIYWNLFGGYDVPIDQVTATVRIPENNFSVSDLQGSIYDVGSTDPSYRIVDNRRAFFEAKNIVPDTALTIAFGWPKGLIDQSAYWKSFLTIYWGFLAAIVMIVSFIVFLFLFWYFKVWKQLHSRTIVAEYEPPNNIRPAEAEVVAKTFIGGKTWPATIVDLAVRGYLKITEEAPSSLNLGLFKMPLGSKHYTVENIKSFSDDQTLEDYEKSFLSVLFENKNTFSTKELSKMGQGSKMAFATKINKLRKNLYKETYSDTKGYVVRPKSLRAFSVLMLALVIGAGFSGAFSTKMPGMFENKFPQIVIFLVTLLVLGLGTIYRIKFATRLNAEGNELKRKILGFRLYLETAEKYRLQNLTPDLFEKYLPYAMVFGIEKKWAKAFETINMQAPNWYVTPHPGIMVAHVDGSGSVSPGFSASAFSASFSSSFSSAFATSTGTGASGGGGGAGGGGGGGGGGAS